MTPLCGDIIGDDHVAPFFFSFTDALAMRSSVSAAKPTTRPGRTAARRAMVARISSSCRGRARVAPLPSFLILEAASCTGRQSATAAAKIVCDVGRQSDLDGGQHVARCLDLDHRDAGRPVEIDRSADQRDPRPGGGGSGGDRIALPARGAVGDVAHRIDRLMRRPGGDDHVAAGERTDGRDEDRPRRRRRSRAARPCA